MRLLGIVRLSDFRETSVSPDQQKAIMNEYADSHGHTVTFVEDPDVSGDYGPFHPKRSTGPWLTDRQDEYDGIICRAINRVARNAEQMLRLIRWAENRDKVLISIKDGIDTTTEAGKTMAKFMAVVAEMELDQIKSRAKDGHIYLTQVAKRWRGMGIPFGYRPYCIVCSENYEACACHTSVKKGYKLEPDPTYAPILVEMVDRYIAKQSLGQIVRWLNGSGIPTSADIQRMRFGKPAKGSRWAFQSVRNILSSHAMLGAMEVTEVLERDDETGRPVKRSARNPLRDENGDLITRAKPIVSYEKWAQVQARLSQEPQLGKPHVKASPLLRVAYCGISDHPMYITTAHDRNGNRAFRYYLCRKANHRGNDNDCPSRTFNAAWLEQVITETVLNVAGTWSHMIRHVKPAEEYSAPLDQAKKAKDNLWELAESGMFKDKADQFRQRLDILEARIAELKDKPSKPAETKWEPTNTTVREYWESLAPDDRWDYLRYMRVKAKVSRNTSESTQENEADECEGIKRLSAETAELCKTIPPITAEMLERSYEHRWQTVTRQYGEITLVIDLGDMAKLRELATKYPG